MFGANNNFRLKTRPRSENLKNRYRLLNDSLRWRLEEQTVTQTTILQFRELYHTMISHFTLYTNLLTNTSCR